MKRLCIYTHIFPARSETFILEHVRGMVRRGYEVFVIARTCGEDISERELEELDLAGVKRVYLGQAPQGVKLFLRCSVNLLTKPSLIKPILKRGCWRTRDLLIAAAAADEIQRIAPVVLHIHFGTNAARLQHISASYKRLPPMVVTWHGYDVNAMPRVLGDWVYKKLFGSPAMHTVGSDFIRMRLIKLGASPDRVLTIPMGVDVEKFAFRERMVEVGSDFRLLTVGRLDEVKGHTYLLSALKVLLDRGINIRLRLVGDGPLKRDLEEKARALGIDDKVAFLGALPSERVIAEMHYAHLFVLTGVLTSTGKVEGQGVVFAEAQATGLPVVACDVGGTSASILDGKTGLLCESRAIDSIANAIAVFVDDPRKLSEFGVNARDFIERSFSNDKMLDEFLRLY